MVSKYYPPADSMVDIPYTMMPNSFLSRIKYQSEAELKVMMVAIRNIIGWHHLYDDPVSISTREFVEATCLCRKTVLKGIRQALKRGWLIRTDYEGTYGAARYVLAWRYADWKERSKEWDRYIK